MTDHTALTQEIARAERGHLGGLSQALRRMKDSLSALDVSGVLPVETQEITSAGAVTLPTARIKYVDVTGPAASTYAITLAAPTAAGHVLIIEMTGTTSTNAVTLALTNVIGGSAGTTATFNAARETLVLVSAGDRWVVLAEAGVTLS